MPAKKPVHGGLLLYGFEPGDETSAPFLDVMAWLTAQGAPADWRVDFRALGPGQPGKTAQVVWTRDGFEDFESDAGAVLMNPNPTLVAMIPHYQLNLDPVRPPLYGYVQEKPQPGDQPTPFPQAEIPIGAPIEGQPGKFYAAPGDLWPAGTLWVHETLGSYRKHVRHTPFGPQPWWEKVA